MQKSFVAVVLGVSMMFASTAHAADVGRFPLDVDSTEPQRHVEGLKQETHRRFWAMGQNIADKARTDWQDTVARGRKFTSGDMQCLVTHFTKAVVDGALAGENSLGVGIPTGVLERYSYFLLAQLEFFCQEPPGGGANLGDEVFAAWYKAASAKADQKSSILDDVRAAIAKTQAGGKLTARDVTIAAAVAIIIAAKELAPTPF